MDRLDVIMAKRAEGYELTNNEECWLIVQAQRLRKIEDAAIALDQAYAEFGDDVSA